MLSKLSYSGSEHLLRFEKVTAADLAMKTYSPDTSAGAVVLDAIGIVEFYYNDYEERFEYMYTVKCRIKIFDANQFEIANQTISLYKKDNSKETLTKLKGKTYTSEDGKILEIELKKDAIFNQSVSTHYDLVKFTLPKVTEGSIIEFEYTINSPYINTLPSWKLQTDIPVKKSTFKVETPGFYGYRISYKGFLQIPEPKYDVRPSSSNFSTSPKQSKIGSGIGITTNDRGTFYYNLQTSLWNMYNIPAISEEPYVSTMDNYTTQINHELATFKIEDKPEVNYAMSWEDIVIKNLDHEDLGKQLSVKDTSLFKLYLSLDNKNGTFLERTEKALNLIRSKISWNNEQSIYCQSTLSEALIKGEGNCAEINLLYIQLLQLLNIEAYPVVLSTREHGFLTDIPSNFAFNYLIVAVKINGRIFLSDATEKLLPFGMLPERCINGKGLLLKKQNLLEWVSMTPGIADISVSSLDVKLTRDNIFSGKISTVKKGYAALESRKLLLTNQEAYFNRFEKENPFLKISEKKVQNLDSIHLPLKEIITFELNGHIQENDSFIFFSPVLTEKLITNPFRLNDRLYPVEFTNSFEKNYLVNITIPDNYIIDEIPASINLILPGNAGKFSYTIKKINEQTIQLNYKFAINKTIFTQMEYNSLKEFYTQFIKKTDEQITIKKPT